MHSARLLPLALVVALLTTPALTGSSAWAKPPPAVKKAAAAPDKLRERPKRRSRAQRAKRSKEQAHPAQQQRGRRAAAKAAPRKRTTRRQRRDRFPPMQLVHANTREKLKVRLYDRQGRTQKSAVRQLTRFLRCHTTGRRHRIHWRLLRNLYRISRHYAGKTITVYSGYRARKVARSRTSRHVRGMAIDLHVNGVSNRRLRDYLMATFKPCGVGFYPNGAFVHFDVRQGKSAFWVDYSGKGETAVYAKDPYAVLKRERNGGKTAATAQVGGEAKQPAAADASARAAAAAALAPAVLPVIQPDIPPLGTVGAAASKAGRRPLPPVSSAGPATRGSGPLSSALRPLSGQRLSIAP